VRGLAAVLTLASGLAAFTPATAQAAPTPRYELLGEWGFHGDRYTFSSRHGAVSGRSRTAVKIGKCEVRQGSIVFRGYRFKGRRGGSDYWKGRLAVVGGKKCKRRLVSSTIVVESDLRFTESSRLPGGNRPPPSTFSRVRPPLSNKDPVLGTWLRNGAGVLVKREGDLYVGRAREAFSIANGCTVQAGSVVWRLRPLAPDRYSGTIQTFLAPPTCAPAALDPSTWLFGRSHRQLVRQSATGQQFPYTRA
jgi:hypothetical protein